MSTDHLDQMEQDEVSHTRQHTPSHVPLPPTHHTTFLSLTGEGDFSRQGLLQTENDLGHAHLRARTELPDGGGGAASA